MTLKISNLKSRLEILSPSGDTVGVGGTPRAVVVNAGVGPQGPQGIQGIPGPPGPSYTHTQSVASDTWIVNHNLGIVPSVEIRNSGSQVVEADVVHISTNQTNIYFAAPFAGTARFS